MYPDFQRFFRIPQIAVAALLVIGSQDLLAQSPSNIPDLSGSWERMDDVGGGSFGGILEKIVPKASLTPEFIEANKREAARQNAGDVVAFSSRWCQTFKYPFFMQHSAGWHIVQTDDEVIQVPEVHTFARHIYIDGRKHPTPMVPNPNGHSIGRWQSNSLIVDSVGFTPGGGTPGGGHIGPATRLTEQFTLQDGGKKLQVIFTWEDPSIYLKPHTYELIYHRSPADSYALEDYCHADDPVQGGSVVQQKQQ